MTRDEVLRLLVIESSLEDAEHLMSTLRNAGIAIRPSSAENEDELQGVLERQPLDILLVNTDHDELTLEQIVDAVARSGKDIPVVALLDEYGLDALVDAMRIGATDAISVDNSDQLEHVVRREFSNLSQRRRGRMLETSLRETEKRCHALLDSSRDAIAYVHEGMHVYANPAYLTMFDYDDFEDLEGLPILDMVASGDAGRLKGILREISKGDESPDDIEIDLSLPDGRSKAAMMEFSPASIDGEPCTQIVLRDKSVDPELAQELRDLKTQDLVTGLANRQFMLEDIGSAIARTLQDGANNALILVEIDNFRSILDLVGLAGVDLVLTDVAKAIGAPAEESDTVGRLGDNSFCILCHDQNLDYAKELAEKVRVSVEECISEVDGQSVTLTASLGVTRITEAVSNAQDLLSLASSAALNAAQEGGNRVQAHDPTKRTGQEDDDSLVWVDRVRDAIENDRFALVFQPVVSLHGTEEQNYEVLLRLQGEGDEMIPAGQFIPHVVGHEIMLKVDQWVIQKAVQVLKETREQEGKANTTFFVKLATQTFSRPEILPWLAKVLRKHRISGDAIVFEAPESKLMTNIKPARQFLKGLKQLHCRFAIEQFGSGLNSFQILKHVPADFLKIDRSFMQNLPSNSESQEKIKDITEQAHAMGKTTIAEFVEDAASMSILWQCGVNYVQGNFLQEPEKILAYDFG
ncbi:MAG: EAL domain-containing protein [Pseudomonadota bacterium]